MERKNVLNLIRVFRETFDQGENNAFLTIKTSRSQKFPSEKEQILQAIGDSKKIKIVEKIFDKNALNYVISNCDSYISLHRSEGFGLTMAEAMYFSKPVIATGYSGNLEFMNEENSFLVPAEVIASDSNVINYAANTVWSEPSLKEAAVCLKTVYEGKDQVQEKAEKGHQTIVEDLSLKRVGQLIKKRGEELFAEKRIGQNKSTLIRLYVENILLKKDLRIYKKSAPIQFIYNIKMYFRNRKGKK